jgi:protein-disulfide isomerase
VLAPVDEAADHVRGATGTHVVVMYGDFECPYSRAACRHITRAQLRLGDRLGYVFRHFPLTEIHPHALAASAAAEAAALQDRFWEAHDVLFSRQKALEDADLRRYADELGLDLARFEADRTEEAALSRIARDVESGLATGQVEGTPTLFVDGEVHRGPYETDVLVALLD